MCPGIEDSTTLLPPLTSSSSSSGILNRLLVEKFGERILVRSRACARYRMYLGSYNMDNIQSSDVDLNTLNLDPDLGFWPDLDPDPGLCYPFKKKRKNKSF